MKARLTRCRKALRTSQLVVRDSRFTYFMGNMTGEAMEKIPSSFWPSA